MILAVVLLKNDLYRNLIFRFYKSYGLENVHHANQNKFVLWLLSTNIQHDRLSYEDYVDQFT